MRHRRKILQLLLLPAVAVAAALLGWSTVNAQTSQPTSVFAPPLLISDEMDSPHSVASADLDADGDQDVVAVSRLDGHVRWFRNETNRNAPSVTPAFVPILIDVLAGSYAVFPADLDVDGDVDLAVVAVTDVAPSAMAADANDEPNGKIVWFQNNGAALPTFTRHEILATLDYPVSVHAADLDNDGDVDLMSASRDDSKVIWYENSGAKFPTFTPRLLTNRYDGAVSVYAGDLNGDGRQDIVFAAENSDTVGWFANQGGTPATFELNILRTLDGTLPPSVDYAKAVIVADVDGDGDNDIAYVSESQNMLSWYENDGSKTPSFSYHMIAETLLHAKALHAADVDQDGDTDLLTASTSDRTFALFENNGEDRPVFKRRDLITDANGARALTVADFNGDGRPDVAGASRYDNRIQWLPNVSSQRTADFGGLDRRVIDRGTAGPIVTDDVDGDGDQDAAIVLDGRVSWYLNDGAAPPRFEASVVDSGDMSATDAVTTTIAPVASADIDRDGDSDLLAVGAGDSAVVWYEQVSETPLVWVKHPVVTADIGRDAFVYDVNTDGNPDIVAALNDRLIWLQQDPGGEVRFAEHVIDAQQRLDRIIGGDLNRDGQLDVAGSCLACDSVYVYLSDGDLPPKRAWQSGLAVPSADGLALADLNRNGIPDLLIAGRNGVDWIADPGTGKVDMVDLTPAAELVDVADLHASDFDGDGDIDLVGTQPELGTIFWLEHGGVWPPVLYPHVVTSLSSGVRHVEIADLTNNGRPDLLTSAMSEDVFAWYEEGGGDYTASMRSKPWRAIASGQLDEWLALTIEHAGRPGAADLALHSLDVRISWADGRPLSATDAAATLTNLSLYRDACCDGIFSPDTDQLLVQIETPAPDADGTVRFTLDATAGTHIRHGERSIFFVAAELTGTCGTRPEAIVMTPLLSRSAVRDSRNGALVTPHHLGSGQKMIEVEDPAQTGRILISEFMADNRTTLEDPQGSNRYPSWLELYNGNSRAVDLSGYGLTSDPSVPAMVRLPAGTVVPPQGFLLVLDDSAVEPPLFDSGAVRLLLPLTPEGGYVGLYGPIGDDHRPIDGVFYEEQPADQAWGRFPTGGSTWGPLGLATPGRGNRIVETAGLPNRIYLPETHAGVAYRDACQE